MTRKCDIVINPAAGRGRCGRRRPELERLLAGAAAKHAGEQGLEWSIHETGRAGHASQIAGRCAADGADIVAAAGGDGTLNEVLNGLAGSGTTLALLPMGTGNDFARTVGLEGGLPHAVTTLFCGVARPIDCGQVSGRRFLNVAGCGFDAVVAEEVNRGGGKLTGAAAYLVALVRTLARFKAADLRVTADGERFEFRGMLCSVANARTYGGGMRIAPAAQIDDGLFDVCLLAEAGRIELIRALPRLFCGTHVTHPKVTMLRARRVLVESAPCLPVLVDGEVLCGTPVDVELQPGVVSFLAPRSTVQDHLLL